jgi:hypothetical protein
MYRHLKKILQVKFLLKLLYPRGAVDSELSPAFPFVYCKFMSPYFLCISSCISKQQFTLLFNQTLAR